MDNQVFRQGLGVWAFSQGLEKSNFSENSHLRTMLLLLAFSKWSQRKRWDSVTLFSAQPLLAKCMRSWCAGTRTPFIWRKANKRQATSLSFPRRIFCHLPHPFQALLWLARYLYRRFPLWGTGLRNWRNSRAKTTFINYLFDALPAKKFRSQYWGPLPAVLLQQKSGTNWLHLFVEKQRTPKARLIHKQIQAWNQNGNGLQVHVTLDSFLSILCLGQTLRDWLTSCCLGWRSGLSRKLPPLGIFQIWPLWKEDWKCSLFGKTAMRNLLFLNLFERAFRTLPSQQRGFYLQENISWEYGLIHAWKNNHRGCIYGHPHSSVRFWDLRYFHGRHLYSKKTQHAVPLPDGMVPNGPHARRTLVAAGVPSRMLHGAEALRFRFVNPRDGKRFRKAPTKKRSTMAGSSKKRLLILGDYSPGLTHFQMNLLVQAMQLLPRSSYSLVVKAHPACPIPPEKFPGLAWTASFAPLPKLLDSADVIYAGPSTSASLEAFFRRLPVILVLDPEALNLSPLRGVPGTVFVSTPGELVAALLNPVAPKLKGPGPEKFFYLDPRLPRWKKLLKLSSTGRAKAGTFAEGAKR